jgi:hypothetical protein
MATWSAPLPPNDVVAGDPGHPEMHNQLVDAFTEARANVDVAETTAAWATVTGKPSTFPPVIGTTATTAVAGNDARLTAGAAGVATVRALGTTGTTAAAGNDVRLLTGTATAQADSVATDVAGLVADFNALLAKLRARGVIAT